MSAEDPGAGDGRTINEALTHDEMLTVLKAHISEHYCSASAAARDWNVSAAYISAILTKKKPPSDKLLSAIGFKRMQLYVNTSSKFVRNQS